jgi:hypothetical protein
MRKIKSKERQNGMRYCTFCKPNKVDAIYRNTNVHCQKKDEKLQFACLEHKDLLIDGTAVNWERGTEVVDYNEHSEANYQIRGMYGI